MGVLRSRQPPHGECNLEEEAESCAACAHVGAGSPDSGVSLLEIRGCTKGKPGFRSGPSAPASAGDERHRFAPLAERPLRVAFLISERATLIDFAGPWEVFQDVIVVGAHRPSEAGLAWLKAASAQAGMTMSVCTGASVLARYLGREVAQGTADFMEVQGEGRKRAPGAPLPMPPAPPVR